MPVDAAHLTAFALASILLVMSPGPDTMLILRNTMASGRASGLATVIGVQLGLLVHTVAAVLGLSVTVAAEPMVFRAIAIAGAVYLAWLGVQSFRTALVPVDGIPSTDRSMTTPARAIRDAILTNVLNPKVILLFVAMMPNFVVVDRGRVPLQLAILAATLIVVNILWQTGLWAAAEQARRWLGRPSVQRAVSWSAGLILILFAVLMLFNHLFD